MTPQPILHIPHSSQAIPPDLRDALALSDSELQFELLRITDHFTDKLFPPTLGVPLVFPVSRLIVDVERFEDDAAEPMAAVGMGVCYTRTHDGRVQREPPARRLALNLWCATIMPTIEP